MKEIVRLLGAGRSPAESNRMEKDYHQAIIKQFGSENIQEAWIAYVEALMLHAATPASVQNEHLPVSASAKVWACVRRWKNIDDVGRIAAGFRKLAGHFELFIAMPVPVSVAEADLPI